MKLFLCVLLALGVVPSARAVPVASSTGHAAAKDKEMDRNVVEGDIAGVDLDVLMEVSKLGKAHDGMRAEKSRWPKAIVPYAFSNNYGDDQKRQILRAMDGFNETCVSFIERTDETNYLHIGPGSQACFSDVGNKRTGKQIVGLVTECLEQMGTIQHELMHALGFYHEQSRKDRDKYVEIEWDHIKEEGRNQFFSYNWNTVDYSYDFGSVMHYDEYMFSRSVKRGLWTIRPRPEYADEAAADSPTGKIGQRTGLSPKDIQKINTMYNCPSTSVPPADDAASSSDAAVTPFFDPDTTETSKKPRRTFTTTAIPESEEAPFFESDPTTTTTTTTTTTVKATKKRKSTTRPKPKTKAPTKVAPWSTPDSYTFELEAGATLPIGKVLWNFNKNIKFELRSDGNAVVIRKCDNSIIWSTFTVSSLDDPAEIIEMKDDGNLVMKSAAGTVLWSTDTADERFAGASLRITNSGTMCLFKDDNCLWESGGLGLCRKHQPRDFAAATVLLNSGERLKVGDELWSSRKKCKLALQADGDLVLQQQCDNTELWSIRHGTGRVLNLGPADEDKAQELVMTEEGNLVVRRANGADSFQITIPGGQGSDLRITNNCQMCVFKDGSCLWTAHARAYSCS
ncbi:putative Zinc metalloproteinase nas-4 [Hypsibius exemplaris]|uniref:Metalloendopeptidase n=1 Tax=Hypsibius exemplaris TaxID=2072580 RepID=A0A1W0WNF2_HYPEX|nr:putative Zinc metalloproteinase nas-4 [Hypsibius exemplaris]